MFGCRRVPRSLGHRALGPVALPHRQRLVGIGVLAREAPAHRRLGGSVAVAMHGMNAGVQLLRVHDVAETRQALRLWQAMNTDHLESDQ